LFTETPAVADERQSSPSSSTSREHARAPLEYRIVACERADARRTEAEAFVRERFLRTHGAHIATFMPTLLLLMDARDELCAAAGFRCAALEPLFLERYLARPIEQTLASQVGARARRAEIFEIGNFAAIDSRRAKMLMSYMPAWFLARAARWIVFTATASIRGILCAMGGRCTELAAADGARVAGGQDEWGRYYSTDPRVMAGYLPSARRVPALWRSHHGD
jgi:hypothetical protein